MNKFGNIPALALLLFVPWALSACGEGLVYDPASAVHKDFSGQQALQQVQLQMQLGPRVAGSNSLEKARLHLQEILAEWGWQVKRQAFKKKTPEGEIEFVNLRVRFVGGTADGRTTDVENSQIWQRPVLGVVCSHYESKKFEAFEFSGANDPGSSVAVLLEMARVMAGRPALAKKLELVLFDGEEAFVDYTDTDGLYGSRYYAQALQQWPQKSRPRWGVLLDMVGDKDLAIRVPADSPDFLVGKLFKAADELGLRKYFGLGIQRITDDHVPLNEAGIPTIDLIDMDYAYWHTPGDTLDKLSAESLQTVGQVTLLMIEKYLLDKSEL